MGYSDSECLFCYLEHGFNEDEKYLINICSDCFWKYSRKPLRGNTCLQREVHVAKHIKCFCCCEKKKYCLTFISICEECCKKINPKEKYDVDAIESKQDLYNDICDGECNCVYCPYSEKYRKPFYLKLFV